MNFGFFTGIWTAIAVRIQAATGQMITALQAYVGTPFKLSVVAYLIITLMIAAWSSDEAAFQRFFRQLWLAAVIFTIATTADAFQTYVQGFANGLTTGISTAIAGVMGGGRNITANSFDIIAIKMFDKGGTVFNGLEWYSPKSWVLGMAVIGYWGVSLAAIVVIFIVYLLSAIETNFILAFGPLFVALFFFPMTRRIFDGWVSCVVGGVLVQVFTIGWLALFIVALGGMMGTIEAAAHGSNAVNDVATQIMTLVLAAALVGIFSAMTTVSALVAVRIASGVYTGMERLSIPARSSEPAQPAPPAEYHRSGSSHQGGGNSSGGGMPAGPQLDPGREYAFQRSVGRAV